MRPLNFPQPRGTDGKLKLLKDRALKQGLSWALFRFGVLVNNGDGPMEKDPKRAFALFRRSARMGVPVACNNVAYFYELGCEGVCQKSSKKASEWLARATVGGHSGAMFSLSTKYILGCGVPRNVALAVELWEKAAAMGDMQAAFHLGATFITGGKKYDIDFAGSVEGDAETHYLQRGINLMRRAAAAGVPEALDFFRENTLKLNSLVGYIDMSAPLDNAGDGKDVLSILEIQNQAIKSFEGLSEAKRSSFVPATNEEIRAARKIKIQEDFAALKVNGVVRCAMCNKDGATSSEDMHNTTWENDAKAVEQRKASLTRCSGCKTVLYCSKKCQKSHWRTGHREICKTYQQARAKKKK